MSCLPHCCSALHHFWPVKDLAQLTIRPTGCGAVGVYWLKHKYDKVNCTYRGGDKTLDQHDAMTNGKYQQPTTTALQHPHLHK